MRRQAVVLAALAVLGACAGDDGDDGGAGALPAEAPCSGEVAVTPRRSDGGHYRSGAPAKASLVEPGVAGTPLLITGYVLFPDCRTVPDAVLDVWQADADSRYDDEGWRLRGVLRADADGRYAIETIVPGSVDGDPPTVHMKVAEEIGGRIVTSQVYLAPPADAPRPELAVEPAATSDGLVARFDVVIETG
jgi:protocatechuate 3,4-dioxygenase beta subunit